MSKKTKDEKIDLLYVNNKNNQTKSKKKSKTKNKNIPKKSIPEDEIINLDNEVIIGLTPTKTQNKDENKKKKGRGDFNRPQKQNKKPEKKQSTKKNVSKGTAKKTKPNKKSKLRIKILKWTSIIILLVGATILFMLSPVFNVKQITVEGVQKLTSEEIIALSQIQLDENTFKIRKSEIIERIQNNSYVETVEITRELPSTIKIAIKEREPQYIIEIANGNAYIDSKGYILDISTEKLELPVLTGYETSIENIIDFENTKKLSDEDCKKLDLANQIIEAARNNNVLSYFTSIDIADITNIKVNLDAEKKVAYLGDCSYANDRILYLKKMIEEEAGIEGEAFINGNLRTLKPKPYFREAVK